MLSHYRSALLLIVLVFTGTQAWAADGRIFAFDGDVQVNGQPLTDTIEVNDNDVITTGADGTVKIMLADNSVLDIDTDSQIKISDYTFNPDAPEENTTEVEIVEGTLRYVSGLMAKENPESIGFSAGGSTIGVRGSYTEIEIEGAVVNVEAMIGEAVVVIDDSDCPEKSYIVPTGKSAQTDPVTCETVLTASTSENLINALAYALAANPNDPDLEEQLAELTPAELEVLVVVINNNADHLDMRPDDVVDAINTITQTRPDVKDDIDDLVDVLKPEDPQDPQDEGPSDEEQQEEEPEDGGPDDEIDPVDPVDPSDDIPPGGAPSPE